MAGEKVCVNISREMYEKAKKFIEEQGGFSSVEELVEFLLEEALSAAPSQASAEDEEKVKERLRSLGYF